MCQTGYSCFGFFAARMWRKVILLEDRQLNKGSIEHPAPAIFSLVMTRIKNKKIVQEALNNAWNANFSQLRSS